MALDALTWQTGKQKPIRKLTQAMFGDSK